MGDLVSLLTRLRLEEEEEDEAQRADQGLVQGLQARQRHHVVHPPGLRIGDRQFGSVNAAWQEIGAVKTRLLGRHIGSEHPDFKFLDGLLARHPRGAAKVEHPPVRQFTAHRNVSGRGIEFHFVDSAGEEHDFSAKKCMEQRDEPVAVRLAKAMALAVHAQVWQYKRGAEQECELCGKAGGSLVVDHFDPDMPELRHNFMRTWQGKAPSQFAEAPQGGSMFRPEDRAFEAAWKAHHRRHANLRLLCEACLLEENSRRSIRSGRGPGRGGARSGRGGGRGGRGGGRGRG